MEPKENPNFVIQESTGNPIDRKSSGDSGAQRPGGVDPSSARVPIQPQSILDVPPLFTPPPPPANPQV